MPDPVRITSQTRTCVLGCWILSFLWLLLPPLSPPLPSSPIPPLSSLLPLLSSSLTTCAILTLLTFICGLLTGNVSQVDKLWSLAPPLYSLLLCPASPSSPRSLLLLLLSCSWGGRLTYNFWRRGGYSWPPWRGEEDYRWAIVRLWPGLNTRLGWLLFHSLFICCYQNLLLLSLALPSLLAATSSSPLNHLDLLASLSFVLLLIIEAVADQQQLEFQSEKHQLLAQGCPLPPSLYPGFPSHGLFSISRHPNYLAEQLLWLTFYLFSVSATGSWLNWSLAGSLALVLLFQGSTLLSESITRGKYPQYRIYQSTVPRFLGNFWLLSSSYPAAVAARD